MVKFYVNMASDSELSKRNGVLVESYLTFKRKNANFALV